MDRRTLLKFIGRAGGTAAVLTTMQSLGLIRSPARASSRPTFAQSDSGAKVAILGAGIAGMTAAYELTKVGYDCTILEARDRAGGRNWTVRGGDLIKELDSQQTCAFEAADSLYVNAGPARIPYHHTHLLGYCKEFGVPLEVMVNENRGAYFQDDNAFAGQPILNRQVVNDTRGYIAELLAKAISQQALDQEVSTDDRDRLLDMVKSFGKLGDDYRYVGSDRAGFGTPPGAGLTAGELQEPLPLNELLNSAFWQYKQHFGEGYNQAATMLEPIGGMDQIAKAFEQRVGSLIQYRAVVTRIGKTSNGVQIRYTDATGAEKSLEADYAICTIPLSVLASIEADFSPEFKAAIGEGAQSYNHAVKIAFESRRFWEDDLHIYGGISWTEKDITQVWYPTAGIHHSKGIILAAYTWDNEVSDRFAVLTPADRLQKAIAEASTIHSNFGQEVPSTKAVSVAWSKIPYSQGAWIDWEDQESSAAYQRLNQPDDAIFLAGEHLSYLTGWQEGAVLSAYQAIEGIAAKQRAMSA
ncbi:flavin monoamine oxidase family protein [Oculatella sp. LEGE 06141]|uniref:flavin monoamine oxidase family protein n=1 Tax=Oculatella sp. LEGE 06141 TaxID=1828648 RepID=UPI0018811429|nr:flavin monoamine oxidase family protein [Oculatella sp. LEGE 06141]MBE9182471.1 flavin monoamine oxidase family protein [Oculatella sp. LEGE 06141]